MCDTYTISHIKVYFKKYMVRLESMFYSSKAATVLLQILKNNPTLEVETMIIIKNI